MSDGPDRRGRHPQDGSDDQDETIDLRALFGADWDDGEPQDAEHIGAEDIGAEDISAEDQQLLRSLFAAGVSDPPPPASSVESILAAARRDAQSDRAAAAEPETDRLPAVGSSSGRPDSATDQRVGGRPDAAGDELAARRRRKTIRSGLLAAAAAAVLAVGIPVAISLSERSGEQTALADRSNSAAVPGGTTAASAAGSAGTGEQQESGAAEGDAAPNQAPSKAGSAPPAPEGAAPNATAGDSGSSSAAGADTAGGDTPGAGTGAAGSDVNGEAGGDAGGGAESGGAGGQGNQSEAAGSSSGATTQQPESCEWPELPKSVDQAAGDAVGPDVVDGHRALTAPCAPNRLGGAVFPAADGSRDGITVEVVRPATDGDCRARGCSPDDGGYAARDADGLTVWVYIDDLEIRLTASAGLEVTTDQLVRFGTDVGAIVH